MTDPLALARRQGGILARRQLVEAGVPASRIRGHLAAGRWEVVERGVYATFTGPLPPESRLWAALLRAGPGAAAGPWSTLWMLHVLERPPRRWDVVVPDTRRPCSSSGTVRRSRRTAQLVHPASDPPRLRLEEAVLEATAEVAPDAVVGLVLTVLQRRLTTPRRLADHLGRRRGHPHRGLLLDLVADSTDGVQSPLERRWLHDVERAHGLPPSLVNGPDHDGRRRCYRDLEWAEWGLVVELDGVLAHPDDRRHRDRARDNRVTVSGRRTLRYGWHEIAGDPCGVAAEVAAVLTLLGRPTTPTRCGPHCKAL